MTIPFAVLHVQCNRNTDEQNRSGKTEDESRVTGDVAGGPETDDLVIPLHGDHLPGFRTGIRPTQPPLTECQMEKGCDKQKGHGQY